MRAYGKDWSYNVYSCRYCLYWKGKKTGCIYPSGCCCPIPQKPPVRNGQPVIYPKEQEDSPAKTECDGCPYGRDSPCLGWCTKQVMKSLGFAKERGSS